MNRFAFLTLGLLTFSFSACQKVEPEDDPSRKRDPIVVVMQTSMGDVTIELNPTRAPRTVENFLKYVEDKHYDGTIFHRVMPGFMIQGGGHEPNLQEKPTKYPPIKLETDGALPNNRGTIAMARQNSPDTATDQFFINVVDNDFRNPKPGHDGYVAFGKVLQGMDVVDKIRRLPTKNVGRMENLPNDPPVIKSIRVVK